MIQIITDRDEISKHQTEFEKALKKYLRKSGTFTVGPAEMEQAYDSTYVYTRQID